MKKNLQKLYPTLNIQNIPGVACLWGQIKCTARFHLKNLVFTFYPNSKDCEILKFTLPNSPSPMVSSKISRFLGNSSFWSTCSLSIFLLTWNIGRFFTSNCIACSSKSLVLLESSVFVSKRYTYFWRQNHCQLCEVLSTY